jgi:hypothetical protein
MAALRQFARFGYVPTMIVGLNLLAVYLVAGGIPSYGSVSYLAWLSVCRS